MTDLSPTTDEVQPAEGQGQAAEQSLVQPDTGQGQQDASTGLYDLSTVPEEYRQYVEPIAKEFEKNTNGRFAQHAEYRKQWEPFEQLGINEYDPEGLGALLQFAEQLADPEQARDAILTLAEQVGIDLGQPAEQEGEVDPMASLEQRLAAQEQRWQAEEEAKEFAAVEAEEISKLRAEWDEVEATHGREFSDDEKTRLQDLASRFVRDHDEPIKAAYAFIQSVSGQAQSSLVNDAPAQPVAAEVGGHASTTVAPPETFEEAQRLFTERRKEHANA